MPRIKSVDVHAMTQHTNQDPALLSRAFAISHYDGARREDLPSGAPDMLNADLLRAVGADYCDGIDEWSDVSASDIWQAWNNGYGVVAAGMLMGATDCAHVSAVQWAHAFNGTLGEGFWNWTNSAQFEEWWTYCLEHVTICGSCEAHNFDADPESTCGNCKAPMSDGHPLGVEAEEFADLVYGYVTAATWSSLQLPPQCPECDERLSNEDERGYRQCSNEDCEEHGTCFSVGDGGDVDYPETGSDPHEFGPDDLDASVLREIRGECADFVRANLADLKSYVQACEDGTRIGYHDGEGSPWQWIGYDLYLTGAGHGAGFWDRGLGELGDRLSEASKVMSAEHLGLWLNSEDGRIYR